VRGDLTTSTNEAPLAHYEAACRALAKAKSVDEVKDIRDQAMAMRLYAKQAKNKDLEADAAEIRLRAERRVGQMMEEQKETVGLAPAGRPSKKIGFSENPITPTLAEAGIDKNLANRARKFAAMDETSFSELVADTRDTVQRGVERAAVKAVEIAAARASYESRKEQGAKVDDLHALARSGRRFAVVLADPPWSFKVYSRKGKLRSAERHYDCMSLDDIKALPVASLAADDCALFLWGICPEVPGALDVIKAWGFEFTTKAFVWAKLNPSGEGLHTGMGYWTRANSEDVWLATRGNPQRLAMDVHQIIMAPVGQHSEKPAEVHARIERLVAGPYLELFARTERPGWTVWGNEIAREASP
jgi:N6-adenosine-specific RNA methylase IME4